MPDKSNTSSNGKELEGLGTVRGETTAMTLDETGVSRGRR